MGLQMVLVLGRFRIGIDSRGRLPEGLSSHRHGQVDGWEEEPLCMKEQSVTKRRKGASPRKISAEVGAGTRPHGDSLKLCECSEGLPCM